MNTRWFLASLTLLLLLLLSELNANDLTLDSCIDKAISSHPDIHRFMLQVQKSQSGIKAAKADFLPKISINGEYDPLKTFALPQNGTFHTIEDDGWQAGITLTQKLWDFSKTGASIKASKIQKSIADLSLMEAKALLSYQVAIVYETLQLQKEAIIVREEDVKAKKAFYKQAKALVKQGLKTKADASRFRASWYSAKERLAITKADFEKARVQLAYYIGETIPQNVILEKSFSDDLPSLHTQKVLETVLQHNPSLKSLRKNIKKDALLYKAVKASHYGSIDAVASYNRQKTLNEYDTTLVGIKVNIPLYSGGKTSALVQQSFLQMQSEKERYKSKVLALKQEAKTLLVDVRRYHMTIQSKKEQLKSAKETMAILQARYKEGLSTYIEVLDAKALLLSAELGLLNARFARSAIFHRLQYLEGKIL